MGACVHELYLDVVHELGIELLSGRFRVWGVGFSLGFGVEGVKTDRPVGGFVRLLHGLNGLA